MCLAVPMRVVAAGRDSVALCERDGLRQEVDLSLVDNVRVGDYVIVHAGYAIEKLDLEEARLRFALFSEPASAADAAPGERCPEGAREPS